MGAFFRWNRSAIACLVLPNVVSACGAGWHRVPGPEPGTIRPRQQVQVWHDGRAEQWHAVVVSNDSVSGIPFHRPIDCYSCRVALPRLGVDSLRFGNPTAGFWKTIGLVMTPFAALALLCVLSDEGGPPCSE